MSKSQNPLTGQMSGSMANFATYKRFGKNIIRSKAFQPKNANTVSQKAQRASFKLIVNAFESFGGSEGVAFPKRPIDQSAFNAFMVENIKTAIDKTGATPVIDYSKLLVAKGTLPKAPVISATASAAGIAVNYNADVKAPRFSSSDEVVVLAVLKNGNLFTERQERGNEALSTIMIQNPDTVAADVVCCYLYVLSADGSNASVSTYVQVV